MTRPLALVALLVAALLSLAGPAPGTASAARPELGVIDGRIVDRSGGNPVPVQLRGVNRSGTEYACTSASDGTPGKRGYAIFDGPTYDSARDVAQPASVLDRMQAWGVTAVRVPLSDACWFGENPALNTKYSGDAYRRAIMTYVGQLADRGMVAILSLHVASTTPSGNLGPQSGGSPVLLPMPQAVQGPRFWGDVVQEVGKVAARNVVYDVFNEPHLEDAVFPPGQTPDAWGCWRSGCELLDPTAPAPAPGAPAATYASAGMEQLVEAIRTKERNTGSGSFPAPIMLGGVDYANDLSEWTSHLPPGPGLVASFHLYGGGDGSGPFPAPVQGGGGSVRAGTACADVACWLRTVTPIASGSGETNPRPVVTGEVGQYDCRSGFTRDYLAWADGSSPDAQGARPISYLAWTWNAMYRGDAGGDLTGRATGWRCDGGPTVLKHNDGTPTDGFGLGVCQHLRTRAGASGLALPGTNPCPQTRTPSEPPADATPVPTVPATPTTPTTPTTPATPTTPGAPTAPPAPTAPTDPGATTPAAPVVPPAGTALPDRPAVPAGEPRTARVSSSSLRLRKGRVAIAVTCPKGGTPCAGRVRVRTTKKVALGRRRAVLVLVNAPYRLKAGARTTVRVAPTKDGAALLRRSRRIAAVATSTSDGGLPSVRRLTLSR